MQVRRVASGQDANGKSKVVSDEIIHGVAMAGGILTEVWGADAMPSLPNSGERPGVAGFFPPAGGYRFLFNTIAPAGEVFVDDADAAEKLGSGVAESLEHGENEGMHTTDTVDLIVIISGVAGLEFDDGEKVLLNQGDLFIQNGARHRWFNPTDQPTTFVAIMIGGVRT